MCTFQSYSHCKVSLLGQCPSWLSLKEALRCLMSSSGACTVCRRISTRHSNLLFLRNLIPGYTPREPVNQTPNCASLSAIPPLCFPDSTSCLYFHGPRIFSFLGSPLQLKLHFYSFKDLLRPPQRIQHIASPNYFSSTLTQDYTIPPALQIHTWKTSTTRIMMSIIMKILSVLSAYWETCPFESQSHENLCFFKADSGKTLPWVTIMKQGKP